MQARLFRFEILRSLAPAVFEARDPTTGGLVTLYEWTPPPADRGAAKLRLAEVAEQLQLEVFTADASLYLAAASPALGIEGIDALRQHGLFTGVSLQQAPPPPVAPPVVPEPPPSRPAPALVAPPRRGRPLLIGLSVAAALAAGYAGGTAWQSTPACPAPIVDTAGAQALATEASQSRQLRDQLASERQIAEANAAALAASSSVILLRVKNDCSTAVRAAAIYTGFNRERIAQGWVTIAPGEVAVVASSPVRDFAVYATTAGGEQSWGADLEAPIETVPAEFTYAVSAGLENPEKVTHGTFSVHVNSPTDVSLLDCKVQ